MRHEAIRQAPAYPGLIDAIARDAAIHDSDGSFPRKSFDELESQGLVGHPPLKAASSRQLLHLLSTVGRGDLSVGRIFEGHVNTLFLVDRYAGDEQREIVFQQAKRGALFGVWNSDLHSNPLRIHDGALKGAKSFASGVDGLKAGIVTVESDKGRQMVLVPTELLIVDRRWWRPSGMRASGSHIISMDGIHVSPDMLLGAPGDYLREPFFSGGAIRCVAVQTGGIHAVFDCAVAHLRETSRAGNAYQGHRIARMGVAVQTAYEWLARGADAWAIALGNDSDESARYLIATTQGARAVVERSALDVLELAECAVGAAGFNAPHPLERLDRDLRTYLRQPDPDRALTSLGEAIVEGAWAPSFLEADTHVTQSSL